MDILVADDDRTARFLLTSTLIELGHSVTEATNGGEAWEAWKREHHQLVISDWMMPGVDGLELCRRIRAEEESGFAYIILIIARVRVAMRILDLHQRLRLANTDLERKIEERTAELEKAL